jgi:hypothetical protein
VGCVNRRDAAWVVACLAADQRDAISPDGKLLAFGFFDPGSFDLATDVRLLLRESGGLRDWLREPLRPLWRRPSVLRAVSFDPGARWECRQSIPACDLFHPTVRVERETGSAAPSDARKAFDDLFK